MNDLINSIKNSALTFAKEEEGAQVIEYALIVAVVSIVLVMALSGLDGGFTGFKTRVENCLKGASTCLTGAAS